MSGRILAVFDIDYYLIIMINSVLAVRMMKQCSNRATDHALIAGTGRAS